MQNTAVLSSSPVISNTATVVTNDTSVPSTPSIKVAELGVPVTVSVGQSKTAITPQPVPMTLLVSMETARQSWETNELAASNKRLYGILFESYDYYLVMKQHGSKDVREAHAQALKEFIAKRGYTFMPSTHDMTRVVKCVFGVDRRRISAYSIALREALRQEVAAKDLITFLEENGGVEQIRLGGTKPLSATMRAGKVKDEVTSKDLGLFKFDARLLAADADWADKQVVIVATYLPSGEFQANAVIRHDTAVNAALAAYYSQQQAKVRDDAKTLREAQAAAVALAKKVAKTTNKPSGMEAQQAKTAAEIVEKQRLAAKTQAFNALLA